MGFQVYKPDFTAVAIIVVLGPCSTDLELVVLLRPHVGQTNLRTIRVASTGIGQPLRGDHEVVVFISPFDREPGTPLDYLTALIADRIQVAWYKLSTFGRATFN